MKKIALLMGGLSKEREVSLKTGAAILGALQRRGYEVVSMDIKDASFIDALRSQNFDAAFIALHGRYGEDGSIQGILEWLKIPYTGSSIKANALCFDKVATKAFLSHFGVPSPKYQVLRRGDDLQAFVNGFDLPYPVIVKPNTEGSTIGISRVFEAKDLAPALTEALKYDSVVLIEQYIQGREVTVGVLGGFALPIIEIRPKGGFYDFTSKYTPGATEYLVPAPIEEDLATKLQNLSVQIFKALECAGAVRADFMIDASGEPFFLEVNTIPGMTETSLLPKAAQCAGINFEDLCVGILEGASLKV